MTDGQWRYPPLSLLHHRWVVERSFAWLTQLRRLVRDYTTVQGRMVHEVTTPCKRTQDAHREGAKVANSKGRLRGKQPKLKPNQAKHLLELHDLGTYTQAELAEGFGGIH